MNYLAHLHIATHTDTCLHGNLLGDFVKGKVQSLPYPESTLLGIQLHRRVDSATDSHPLVKELKGQFGEQRRYAGIVLDVLFDHVLAQHFQDISGNTLGEFCDIAYRELSDIPLGVSERYRRVVTSMTERNWLEGYQNINNIRQAIKGIEQRLSRPVDLSFSIDWYLAREDEFQQAFFQFYQDLLQQSQRFKVQLNEELEKNSV